MRPYQTYLTCSNVYENIHSWSLLHVLKDYNIFNIVLVIFQYYIIFFSLNIIFSQRGDGLLQLRNKKRHSPSTPTGARQVLRGVVNGLSGGGYATQKMPRPVRTPGHSAIDTDIYIYIYKHNVREYYFMNVKPLSVDCCYILLSLSSRECFAEEIGQKYSFCWKSKRLWQPTKRKTLTS